LSNRQYPLLKTFAEAQANHYMTIAEAQRYDQRPFRSMLVQGWISYQPGRGFRITREGREVWEEFERTSQVVDSLMLLARADSGKESLERVSADACAIVRSAAEQGERLARNRDVDFSVDLPSKPIPVLTDPEALRRALLILMDNAAKYTTRGGSVKVGLARSDGWAVASVADSGIGIGPQDVAHIFDRFWRADKARSRAHGGAGLGLSIAKWIVDMHGGKISVQSEPGIGSVFEIRVPMDKDAPAGY
jgi:signal transduction histidine kinase